MRFWIEKVSMFGGARSRGVGIWFKYGTTGSTAGDSGRNMFFTAIVGLWWQWEFNFAWKRF